MNNKKIVIFGASRGIGHALACEYSAHGADMVLFSMNTELLKQTAERTNAKYLICDITQKSQVKDALGFASDQLGNIDLVIINSGLGGPLWMKDFSSDEIKRIYDVNVFGTARVFEYFIPFMKTQGYGTIAGISSLADVRGYPGSGAYSSSKAAVSVLLESARIELRKDNIRVITVRPGFVRTAMTEKNEFKMPFLMSAEEAAAKIRKGIEAGKSVVNFPLPVVITTMFLKILPNRIFDPLMRYARSAAKRKD